MQLKKVVLGAIFTLTTVVVPSIAYGQAYGTVATQTLNVRQGATTDRAIVKQLDYKEAVEIVDQQNGWLKVILGNDARGYVKADYLAIHRVVAEVDANGLRVRDYPDLNSSKILGQFTKGEEISVHFKVGDWYKISQEGFEGYVHKDYIKSEYLNYLPTKKITEVERLKLTREQAQTQTIKSPQVTKPTTSNTASASSTSATATESLGHKIVADAKQFVGNPYVYGGNSLTNGVDCSGFTQQIMARHGISLSRSSSAQYANNGYKVSSSELKLGDLTFYGYNGKVSHVAIYIGNGQIVHANDERTGIKISNVFPSNGKPYIGAKRVIK